MLDRLRGRAPDRDISCSAEGWLYLAVLIDLFSRRIVGWAVSDRLKKDLARCPAYGADTHPGA